MIRSPKMYERWKANLPGEVAFWRNLATRDFSNKEWVEKFRKRVTEGTPWADRFSQYLATERTTRILDVGAGPHSQIGTLDTPSRIELVAVDPLADEYAQLLKDAQITPVVKTLKGEAENLAPFGYETFDFVYSRNALDHSYDPILGIQEMVKCCRVGGYVVVEGSVNEGEKQKYSGLHMWNFQPLGRYDVAIWNQDVTESLRTLLGSKVSIMVRADNWYYVEMKRLA